MTRMGSYCKAYPIDRLRQYPEWRENVENMRKEKQDIGGREVEVSRPLRDDDYLFLQENFVVTDGIFIDEHIIFDDVTDAWKAFCAEQLEFQIPDFGDVAVGDDLAETATESGATPAAAANASA